MLTQISADFHEGVYLSVAGAGRGLERTDIACWRRLGLGLLDPYNCLSGCEALH